LRTNRWTTKALSVSTVGAALDTSAGNVALSVSGTASGKTITSITGGGAGQWAILKFTDSNVSITSAACNLAGAASSFTGANGDVLCLFTYDGTTWDEYGRKLVSNVVTPVGGIAAASTFSFDPKLIHTGGIPARVSTDGTDATPVATEVYYAQITIPANTTVTGVSNFNGSVASGNVKVGLADSTGAVVATSASTAMSGTDAYQRIAFTAPYAAKGPATYYVLLFVDNNTARVNCHTFGDFIAGKQTGQVFATGFTTITPGSTFTTALGPIASLY